MTTIIDVNAIYTLEIIVTSIEGKGVPDLTINYIIKKSENNMLLQTGILDDIGEGIYTKNITIDTTGQYRVHYILPDNWENTIETLLVQKRVDTTTMDKILDNTASIISGLNILPSIPNSTTSEPIGNLYLDTEFSLLSLNSTGSPLLTIHYNNISIQCTVYTVNTIVNIDVSNDGVHWITIHTFYNNNVTNMICYKYVKAVLISGKAEVKCVVHKTTINN